MNGNVAMQSSRHRHTLRSAKFQHRLHILTEKRCLNSHLVGQILLYQPQHALKDAVQAHIVVVEAAELYHTKGNH